MASINQKNERLIPEPSNSNEKSCLPPKKRFLQGGYECTFVDDPPKQIQTECSICLCILRDPHHAECCGYSFCKTCIDPILTDGKPCPLCNEDFKVCIPSKQLQRTLNEIKVHCSHKKSGCEWNGELNKLEHHLNVTSCDEYRLTGCGFALLQCTYCEETHPRKEIEAHEKDQCLQRPYSCDYCHDYASRYEDVVKNHYPGCGSRPAPCPNECGVYPERKNIEHHLAKNCPLQVIDCPFQYAGCDVTLPRQEMPNHISSDLPKHMSLQAISHKQQLAELQAKLEYSESRINILEEENRVLKKMVESECAEIKRETKLRSVNQKAQNEMFQNMARANKREIQKMNTNYTANVRDIVQVKEENKELKHELDKLGTELESRMSSTSETLEMTFLKKLDAAFHEACTHAKETTLELQSQLSVPPLNFAMHEFAKYKSNHISWYSFPFFTHPHGYKMCLRVDANGCGEGEGSHISVYLHLMRGEFDEYLSWPFRGTITIKLINDNRHRTLCLECKFSDIPNIDNSRVTDKDICEHGCGHPKFLSHEDLVEDRYLKYNSLRFKIADVDL